MACKAISICGYCIIKTAKLLFILILDFEPKKELKINQKTLKIKVSIKN